MDFEAGTTRTSTASSPTISASILLLCGLPGSGKSTLASSIVKHFTSDKDISSAFNNVEHIEYDSITAGLVVSAKTYMNNTSSSRAADMLKNEDGATNSSFTDQDLIAWRETRKEALELLQKELHNAHSKESGEENCLDSDWHTRRVLIIMDDNFHLRSMRRDIYKACQDFIFQLNKDSEPDGPDDMSKGLPMSIGLSTLFVDTSLEDCKANNETRLGTQQYIPPKIIIGMNDSLEPPDGNKANFEKHSINTSDCYTCSTNHDEFYEKLDECLKSSILENPIQPPIPSRNIEELEKERLVTLNSRLHHIDLLLRTLVGATCKTNRKFAKVANDARKSILKECKHGSYSFQIDTTRTMNKGKDTKDIDAEFTLRWFGDIVLAGAEDHDCNNIQTALRKSMDDLYKK